MSKMFPGEGVMKYERRLKETETERVFDQGGILVLKPLSAEASALYGRQTRWCVSMAQSNRNWSNYTAANDCIYIVINRNLKLDDPLYKVLAIVQDDGVIHWFDALDNLIEKPNFIE